ASTYFRPFSAVAAAGLPTPVSSVTCRHFLGAQAHPSRSPATLNRRARPGPASDNGRTSSGATWSMTLVSSSPAWSPKSEKNDFARAPLPRVPRRQGGDPLGFDVVGRVGQVEVVRFRRTPRQHRDVVARVAHGLPGQLVQDVGARRHRVPWGTGTLDTSTLGL